MANNPFDPPIIQVKKTLERGGMAGANRGFGSVRSSSPSSRPAPGPQSLDELDDVDLLTTEPTHGQTLVYSVVTGKWEPGDAGGGGGGGSAVPPYISDRQSPVDAATMLWQDEFFVPGDPVANGWTKILPSGTLDGVCERDVLSMAFDAQSGSHLAGYGRALPAGLPTKFAIETSYRVWTLRQNYLMAGPFVSNGVALASVYSWFMPYWGQTTFIDSHRRGTATSIATTHYDSERYPYGAMGTDTNLVRMVVDTVAGTAKVERSLDGVKWSGIAGAHAMTFAPTHFGFGVSSWAGNAGANWDRLTSVDYMRIYDLT